VANPRRGRVAYQTLRETFGGVLLLGLEILVAADLVRTVAVDPTLQNVAILGAGLPQMMVTRSCWIWVLSSGNTGSGRWGSCYYAPGRGPVRTWVSRWWR
jgi:hypothetical protein